MFHWPLLRGIDAATRLLTPVVVAFGVVVVGLILTYVFEDRDERL